MKKCGTGRLQDKYKPIRQQDTDKKNCPACPSHIKEIKNNMGVLVAIILVALTAIIGWLLGDNDPRGKF